MLSRSRAALAHGAIPPVAARVPAAAPGRNAAYLRCLVFHRLSTTCVSSP